VDDGEYYGQSEWVQSLNVCCNRSKHYCSMTMKRERADTADTATEMAHMMWQEEELGRQVHNGNCSHSGVYRVHVYSGVREERSLSATHIITA
jgi:hypothetical protein